MLSLLTIFFFRPRLLITPITHIIGALFHATSKGVWKIPVNDPSDINVITVSEGKPDRSCALATTDITQ
jgi:hypothetical protein